MPLFLYKAENKKGRVLEGVVDAVSAEAVANLLDEKELVVVSVTQKKDRALGAVAGILNRVKSKDLVVFFRQLSVMIKANLPIVSALQILIRQTENKYLKMVIANIADEIEGGAKLSDAMAGYNDIFSNFYVNVVRSGETSGRLSDVIDYLADQQEKDYDLKSKIKGAMIYPGFIISGLFIVGFVIVAFVIPQMTGMLAESGAKLPLATKVLIAISDFLKSFWWLIILLGVGVVITFYLAVKKTYVGRRYLDIFKIKIPIFGKIMRHIYVVRITRSFGTLLKGGVSVAQALRAIRDLVDNAVYEDILSQTVKEVDEGNSISDSLIKYEEMPIMVSQMIAVGEETGRLDEVLEKVTDFYTREIDASVANLSTLIEPAIMVILGVAVGGFMAAVLMPMWQLASSF